MAEAQPEGAVSDAAQWLSTRRATRTSAWIGIACSSVFTVWAVLTKGANPLVNLGALNYPGDDLTIGACGNIILFVTGIAASTLSRPAEADDRGTFWHWRAIRHGRETVAVLLALSIGGGWTAYAQPSKGPVWKLHVVDNSSTGPTESGCST